MNRNALMKKKMDVEAEMNAKDAFAANLQAKLKSLRQTPMKKKVVDEEDFVGLTRKVKRKRVDNTTDDVLEELIRKPATNGVKSSLLQKKPANEQILDKKIKPDQGITNSPKISSMPTNAQKKKNNKKKKPQFQKVEIVTKSPVLAPIAVAKKAPIDTNSLFNKPQNQKVPQENGKDKVPPVKTALKLASAVPNAIKGFMSNLKLNESETSSDEEKVVKKPLRSKLKIGNNNDTDASSDEEKTAMKPALVKTKLNNQNDQPPKTPLCAKLKLGNIIDGESSSDEEKAVKKPVLAKPKPNNQNDSKALSNGEKTTKKPLHVKAKLVNQNDIEFSSDEENTLKNSLTTKPSLNKKKLSNPTSNGEKVIKKPLIEKPKLGNQNVIKSASIGKTTKKLLVVRAKISKQKESNSLSEAIANDNAIMSVSSEEKMKKTLLLVSPKAGNHNDSDTSSEEEKVVKKPLIASSKLNKRWDQETSSDEKEEIKKPLLKKPNVSKQDESDSLSNEEKTIKKPVLVKPNPNSHDDSYSSSDEEKTMNKPTTVKPNLSKQDDSDTSSDEEKATNKPVVVNSKLNYHNAVKSLSNEAKTLKRPIALKSKLNNQDDSSSTKEEEPVKKPAAKKPKLEKEPATIVLPSKKNSNLPATPKSIIKSQPTKSIKPVAQKEEIKSPSKPIAKSTKTQVKNTAIVPSKVTTKDQASSKPTKNQLKQVNSKPAKKIDAKSIEANEPQKSNEVVAKVNEMSLEEAAKAMKRMQSKPKEDTNKHIKIEDVDSAAKTTLYASIIDAAAMEQWDLVEMGRLVRLFCAPFHFKRKKTTRFLLKHCPEFVCADFLEGLNIPLHGFQIIDLLRAGSPMPHILSAKIATCIEADMIKISDDSVLEAFMDLIDIATMSKDEVFEFAHNLIESLRTVNECCRVIKGMTQHWALEDIRHLVQRVILSPVFDDLEGDQEATVNAAFPLLSKLEFPSRLDMEDTNAEGNLDDLCVDDETIEYDHSSHESDDALDEMEARIAKKTKSIQPKEKQIDNDDSDKDENEEDEEDEEDSDEDNEVLLESDSDEEVLPQWNPNTKKITAKPSRQRCRFILDEASDDEDDDDDDMSDDRESSDNESD
ncbi:hypothetical protein THRCLA_06513 [Thraustotheca clavata]|uniref:Uncharacterized protein n=1 Tax=Thraustotheca clavata TaxID=74557 RepID=A0A1V9ZN90_9STRA|nr:hypothetical protein THRCLA_06513 [Thraustotheca clavata]